MAERGGTTTRLSAEERREQVLDAAKSIAADRGFHAVSIEAVARAAGITRPIVYAHFGDLQGLLEALVERESARALAQLAEVLPTDLAAGDARELLLAAQRGYLEVVASDPETWRLILMPTEGAPPLLRERIAGGRAAVVAHLAQAVAAGFGAARAPDPELTAHMLSATADGYARLLLDDPERYPVDRLLAHTRWMLEQLRFGHAR
jgi:AcrR family transcriptional regulator